LEDVRSNVPTGGPRSAASLRQWGPAVDVAVMVHRREAAAVVAAGRAVAPPVAGRAIIDTGSSTTAISFDTAARLRLDPVGEMEVGTGTDIVRAPTFAFSIAFTALETTLDFESAPGLPVARPGQVAIVGRDVLAGALFSYDGPRGVASLEFKGGPPERHA